MTPFDSSVENTFFVEASKIVFKNKSEILQRKWKT